MIKSRFLTFLGDALAAFVLFAIAALVWTYLTEAPPFQYVDLPWATDNPLHPGDPISTQSRRCSRVDHPVMTQTSRQLRNLDTGEAVAVIPTSLYIESGCPTLGKGNATVPENTPPGRYRLEGVTRVEGIMRTFELRFWTQEFEVLSRDTTG